MIEHYKIIMRENNSIFDSTPNGWRVCGGMTVPKKQ